MIIFKKKYYTTYLGTMFFNDNFIEIVVLVVQSYQTNNNHYF